MIRNETYQDSRYQQPGGLIGHRVKVDADLKC